MRGALLVLVLLLAPSCEGEVCVAAPGFNRPSAGDLRRSASDRFVRDELQLHLALADARRDSRPMRIVIDDAFVFTRTAVIDTPGVQVTSAGAVKLLAADGLAAFFSARAEDLAFDGLATDDADPALVVVEADSARLRVERCVVAGKLIDVTSFLFTGGYVVGSAAASLELNGTSITCSMNRPYSSTLTITTPDDELNGGVVSANRTGGADLVLSCAATAVMGNALGGGDIDTSSSFTGLNTVVGNTETGTVTTHAADSAGNNT